MDNSDNIPSLRIQAAPGPTLWLAALVLATAGLASFKFLQAGPGDGRAPLAFVASLVIFVGQLTREAMGAFRARDILTVDAEGFACPGRFLGTVAWGDVDHLRFRSPATICVRLRPEAANRLRWLGLEGWLRRVTRRGGAVLSIGASYMPPHIADAARLMEARVAAAGRGDGAPPIRRAEEWLALALWQPVLVVGMAAGLGWLGSLVWGIVAQPTPWELRLVMALTGLLALVAILLGLRVRAALDRLDAKTPNAPENFARRRKLGAFGLAALTISILISTASTMFEQRPPQPSRSAANRSAGPLADIVPNKVRTTREPPAWPPKRPEVEVWSLPGPKPARTSPIQVP